MQIDKEYTTERSMIGLHSESTGEYPLPDYNADVKRVLLINPRVVPSGRFITESSVEFSGAVFYDVVYLDSENNVTHADFSTDYELAVKIDPETYEDSYVDTVISGYNVRLIGPRKFSAKCSLSSNVRIMEQRCFEVAGDALEGGEPEVLSASVKVVTPVFEFGDATDYREELFSVDGAIEDEVELLMCDVSVSLSSVTYDAGGVDLRGEAIGTVLYRNADSPILTKSVRIPYSGRVEGESFQGCSSLFGRVDVSNLKSEIMPTEEGVVVFVSFSAAPSVRGLGNCEMDVVRDAYLKDRGTSNEYSDFSYAEHISTQSEGFDFSTEIPLSEVTDSNVTGISFVSSVVRTEECELEGTRVRVKGEIKLNAIATEENAENSMCYTNVKIAVPFEEYVNINCQIHENMRPECYVDARNESVEIVDGKVIVRCDLTAFVTLNSQRKQRCLGASYLDGEEYETDSAVVTVYYPDENESVFDIAKKFHTSVQTIAEDNALSQSVFASVDSPVKTLGYKKLLIK